MASIPLAHFIDSKFCEIKIFVKKNFGFQNSTYHYLVKQFIKPKIAVLI